MYAGKVDGEIAILVDTWEGGALVYKTLGREKTLEFVLEAMKKFAKKCGARKLIIFAGAKYARAREFVNFLRDRYEIKEVYFESFDVEDKVLEKYSPERKHHVTDAFGKNSKLKGKIKCFVFNV